LFWAASQSLPPGPVPREKEKNSPKQKTTHKAYLDDLVAAPTALRSDVSRIEIVAWAALVESFPGMGLTQVFHPRHLLVVFGIALLMFGPKKLPELGKGIRELFGASSQQ